MSSKIYWSDREVIQREYLLDSSINTVENALSNEYRRCLKATKAQLTALYDEILASTADGTILVSDLYKYNRYYEMMNTLNTEMKRLGQQEITITELNLTKMYGVTSQFLDNSFGFNLGINKNAANNAVNGIWCSDGKHWSDRIWSDKAALQQRIERGMIDCVSKGVPKDQLVKQLQNDLNVGFRQSDRIARTELTYVQNQATFDKYTEAGIEKYRYLAELDDRTSEQCEEMDGEIFLLSEAKVGTNYPPLHPNCRCTVLAII